MDIRSGSHWHVVCPKILHMGSLALGKKEWIKMHSNTKTHRAQRNLDDTTENVYTTYELTSIQSRQCNVFDLQQVAASVKL